jgi:XTP/dITP diphosphohydrolase
VAPGLLSRSAWQVLDAADAVLCADLDDPAPRALAEAGLAVRALPPDGPGATAHALVTGASSSALVWVGSPDGDPGLTDALAQQLSRVAATGEPPEVEVLVGSHDVTGARLLDLVAVMDRLRSPGGCPWDAEQTHDSLVPYLIEEAHEAVEAIETGDRAAVREELGDVLLQVVFHARVGQEHPTDPFDVDDVAAGIVAKLVRRHPHVFSAGPGDGEVTGDGEMSADGVQERWDELKAAEKGRAHVLDGVPAALPALARADKVLGRLERSGLPVAPPVDPLAADLLELVRRARAEGVDAEGVLRAAVREIEQAARGEAAGGIIGA